MKLLLSIGVSVVLLFLLEKQIKKYSPVFYIGAVIVGLMAAWMPSEWIPGWLNTFVTDYIRRGVVATSLFLIVMYAILMPPKSKSQKVFMGLRGEIAIMASLLILSHNMYYGKRYFRMLFTDIQGLQTAERVAALCSLLMIALLIPLTITSFKTVRRKMPAKKWKQLQRWSYLYYALMYLHVATIFSPQIQRGNMKYCVDLCIYTILFGGYAALRIRKYYLKKKKVPLGNRAAIVGAVLSLGVCIGVSGVTVSAAKKTEQPETEQAEESKTGYGYQDGTWDGEGIGYYGKINVEVLVESGEITNIKVVKYEDDDEYFQDARSGVVKEILDQQSTEVDVVSGATYSSKGIIKAVEDALEKAKQ
ncbi:MAG: FMN-binding protein [Lachnospiraceae bacterium]|nr:FMN-binding protein [Robinsoniella sp.]MDY3767350.1 FMN-binding protein [Lachnospiraceae bacterium]